MQLGLIFSKCSAVAEKSAKFEDFGKIVKMNEKR